VVVEQGVELEEWLCRRLRARDGAITSADQKEGTQVMHTNKSGGLKGSSVQKRLNTRWSGFKPPKTYATALMNADQRVFFFSGLEGSSVQNIKQTPVYPSWSKKPHRL
jgi:hypothetical protein